jgi:mono/diheme cytochrome c family protein
MKYNLLLILVGTTLFTTYSCTPKPKLEVPEKYKKGQNVFHKICSNCHGSDAVGKHTQAPRLIDEEYLSPNFTDDDIRETILNGTDKMPPQRKNVSDKDIVEIIKYLRYSQKAAGLEPQEEEEEEEEEE